MRLMTTVLSFVLKFGIVFVLPRVPALPAEEVTVFEVRY